MAAFKTHYTGSSRNRIYPCRLLKKDVKFNWANECQDAFDKLKETLTTKPVLNLYNPDVTCHVFVDASQKSVEAVLKQPDASNVLHPIVILELEETMTKIIL
ncbi:hypothetical protein AVEN_181853-1 [Araneus ventricosus]|uniref:Reverse transcriptase/retrotransposon-derived protein RNase H-like domain-containing protein n=1 Tax=Araneus ventricosus TaxID=182803 RepID=A0A4Y2TSJ4_ARAVE|nr:hypothetical protein AVEN_181853-1 [Araneus ventricosus]